MSSVVLHDWVWYNTKVSKTVNLNTKSAIISSAALSIFCTNKYFTLPLFHTPCSTFFKNKNVRNI